MAEVNQKIIYSIALALILVVGLPIPIASFIISQDYNDDECLSTHDTLNIDLSQWLFGEAIYLTILMLCSVIMLTLDLSCGAEGVYMNIYRKIYNVINFIFVVIYSTMGAVVLVENKECLGNALGDLAFAVLAITWIGEACSIGSLARANRED